MKSFLNPEGHQNRISNGKVTVILLKGLILPIGGVALHHALLESYFEIQGDCLLECQFG